MWIMEHSAGVDVVLGTDFMIPAGVRLDLFHGTARLPDEVTVPLVKSANTVDDEPPSRRWADRGLAHTTGRVARVPTAPKKAVAIDARAMDKKDLTNGSDGDGISQGQACVNPSDERATSTPRWYYGYPKGSSHAKWGYVRLDSSKYNEWQVLAYAEGRDDTLLRKEKELYECWLAEQPPADDEEDPAGNSVDMLELAYISAMHEIEAEIAAGNQDNDENWYEHIQNEMELADYAHELAFLPDLTEPSSTVLDYTEPNVVNENLSEDEQRKLVLRRHEEIMIASGNALPPPAYGVVCDIDVQGHMPIKQRARRTPLRDYPEQV
ncbi:LOW QUALITY PROTEIN: hypothetical protein PHMEG_00039151 [Phytophthora megakarya]|uniref:Eukaryotic/viral aspartic protease n=1 Tax=Phytophthora megakarya TaxID=4795 RepID=A0A225UG35_9STRA|nr:LOW QUALITY PROTEIN: hypothetical protein PHMEG_00039151 [Phytophthora megakarya]